MRQLSGWPLKTGIIVVAVGVGYVAWGGLRPQPLPAGIASANGRIEATDIDVATKTPGRVSDILVKEGDFVVANQVLARMNVDVLQAQRREAAAELRRTLISIDTARAQVVQRRAEKQASMAVVSQRKAELDAASRRFVRSEQLAQSGSGSIETLDNDRARFEGAKASVSVAEAQVAAADSAISVAELLIINADAAAEAAKATIDRIQADIDDSELRSPRNGRVQYRVAQPGEVLAAGGKILNILDLTDVYMTFFLPTAIAGRVGIGTDVRIVLDAAPDYVIPAKATHVADVAQFTPKTVETAEERAKLMFRIKASVSPALLEKYVQQVKTGLPGTAYVRLDSSAPWPAKLHGKLLQ